MRRLNNRFLGVSVVALVVSLNSVGVATAQQQPAPQPPGGGQQNVGMLTGTVARCVNGAEVPAEGVVVSVDAASGALAHTNASGDFLLGLPPGTYTVIATASDASASRPYVPVESGTILDIGTLDLGAGPAGCGSDSAAPAQPAPPATATAAPAAPSPAPTTPPPPTSTPASADTTSAPAPADATPAPGEGTPGPDDSGAAGN